MLFNEYHRWLPRAAYVGLALSCCIATAHEDHEHQIQRLDIHLDQLSLNDTSEILPIILRRADLHRRELDWDSALADYQRVADIDPNNLNMMLGRAQLHLDRLEYAQALHWSARLLRQKPAHAHAGILQARALAGSGDFKTASLVFDRSIRQLDAPTPEHFLEQVKVILAEQSDLDTRRRAIDIINAGAEALSHPVSLHSVAYKLEVESEDFSAALRRIDSILSSNNSLLNWKLQRGELLLNMGRDAEARNAAQCLIHQIQQLPAQRRNSRGSQALIARSHEILRLLGVHDSPICD